MMTRMKMMGQKRRMTMMKKDEKNGNEKSYAKMDVMMTMKNGGARRRTNDERTSVMRRSGRRKSHNHGKRMKSVACWNDRHRHRGFSSGYCHSGRLMMRWRSQRSQSQSQSQRILTPSRKTKKRLELHKTDKLLLRQHNRHCKHYTGSWQQRLQLQHQMPMKQMRLLKRVVEEADKRIHRRLTADSLKGMKRSQLLGRKDKQAVENKKRTKTRMLRSYGLIPRNLRIVYDNPCHQNEGQILDLCDSWTLREQSSNQALVGWRLEAVEPAWGQHEHAT